MVGYTGGMRLNFRNSQLERVRSVYEAYFAHQLPYQLMKNNPDVLLKRLDNAVRNKEPLAELKSKPIWRKDLRFINLGHPPPALVRWRYMQGH